MHVKQFLHNLFSNTIHKARVSLLVTLVEGVIKAKKLNLTALGRTLEGKIHERSSIFKVDRFFRNPFFLKTENQRAIYQAMTLLLVGNKKRPSIIVDWSKFPHVEQYILRASLAVEGRALTLYEEVHPKSKESNRLVHKQFLAQLKAMLPTDCRPIIITDAGFKNPWFKAVFAQGWDYIGRVRGLVKYREGKALISCKSLHEGAKEQVEEYLWEKKLSRKGPLLTHFYRYKHLLQGRKKYTKKQKINTHPDSVNYGKSYREPWIIVSSIKNDTRVIRLYKQRMTIEEAFRDMKSAQYGLDLRSNCTRKSNRFSLWLLLAALASFIAWIVGYYAEKQTLHRQFQANTVKKRVLSFFYLGCQIIRKKKLCAIPWNDLDSFEPACSL